MLQDKCDRLSKTIITELNSGGQVELGMYTAEVVPGGRRPKWKDEFIARLGMAVADEVIANTPYKEVLQVEAVSSDD